MYSLKKMTQKISKTYTLSFPKAAHSLEAQDQGAYKGVRLVTPICNNMELIFISIISLTKNI